MKLAAALFASISLLSACHGYQPGSFAAHGKPFPGARVTLECLDIAIAANTDEVANGAIARFSMANRCDRAATLDFTRLIARRRQPSGDWQIVRATDPRDELRRVSLEARSVAIEYLEYKLDDDGGALCFELAGLVGAAVGDAETELCLDARTAEASR